MLLIPSRDELVSVTVGQTSYNGVSYSTTAESLTGLLAAGSADVNYGTPVPAPIRYISQKLIPVGSRHFSGWNRNALDGDNHLMCLMGFIVLVTLSLSCHVFGKCLVLCCISSCLVMPSPGEDCDVPSPSTTTYYSHQ